MSKPLTQLELTDSLSRSGIACLSQRTGEPEMIRDLQTGLTGVPSVVGVDLDGKVYVGQHAINTASSIPEQNLVVSFKRLIGKR